ncbi:DUF29 domain-containing protein [Limnofasciculus baicalensis]|uniref:DUF29 domain-containing protein n=1 Tax=Limnofasciculus baicalensis BBK-W-15 TaxID=2699891 RepID=A0AAE3GU88_9CYAN|nr:DUF29 domain-containing protein [Limnofasciculus baicalensis]MCP2730167.1 DUF29 domain-containing protein [Limnofasciculus baicalensis BBK-W-15]
MTVSQSNETKTSSLYECDFCAWAEETAFLLRSGKLSEIDLDNLIDEVEDMSRNERRALLSNLRVVLMHLLNYKYQPEKRSSSWLSSIREHRTRIGDAFRDSPSLRGYFLEMFDTCYQNARKQAADETELHLNIFPQVSPFTPEESLNEDFLPK